MFKHYLKMAIRQILKNKIQYLLSIIGIAVGLLCFSMTSYYIRTITSLLLGQTAIGWRIYMPNRPNTVMRTLIFQARWCKN